jgi:hypothetical protein
MLMAKANSPLLTQTKLDNEEATDAKVSVLRTVTYVFEITSAENLSIPYAVAIAGMSQAVFKDKPKRVSGENGVITVRNVDPGKRVCLFLNSDAHPGYRKNPVYEITPVDHDVTVKIKEKLGKNSESDVPIRKAESKEGGADIYTAVLNGDIWMKISHRYSSSEVDLILSGDTSETIKSAIRKIYDGLTHASLEIDIPVGQGPNRRVILIKFEDGKNPRDNISSGYDFLNEGLTRVHPAGYAAIITAAIESGINKVVMTSAWRPMLGSIAHRAGLGLDVNYVGITRMNREELRDATAIDTANVSEAEKNMFSDFKQLKAQEAATKKTIAIASSEVKNAGNDPGKLVVAKQRLKEATEAGALAEKNRRDAEAAWNVERNKNEPLEVRNFRASLTKCKFVAQIFDPWFMDANSRDNIPATPNIQVSENEKLHSHHLHITVNEPKIL